MIGKLVTAISIYKLSHKINKKYPKLSKFLDRYNYFLHNSVIPGTCEIGNGTQLSYGGIGVVIHAESKIGKECMLGQGITIGRYLGKEGVPIIEDNVYISAGARVIGNIRIGHDSIIGPNCVVVRDIEPYSVCVGIPAKVIAKITNKNINKYRAYGIKKFEIIE